MNYLFIQTIRKISPVTDVNNRKSIGCTHWKPLSVMLLIRVQKSATKDGTKARISL